jgi:hypothetical protein
MLNGFNLISVTLCLYATFLFSVSFKLYATILVFSWEFCFENRVVGIL